GPGGDPPPWDSVIAQAHTLHPGSPPPLGGGINEAQSNWKSHPKDDLSLIVLTDGMQNTPPLIAPTASGFLGLQPVAGFPQELRKRFVPLHTIAFGTPAQVDDDLMRAMGLETSGASYQAVSATTIFDTFGMTLVSILKGNTVSITTRR